MRLRVPAASKLQVSKLQEWTKGHLALLLCTAALILYFTTLDNGLQPEELRGGDLITHQYAQVQARPSNAPGYPLYTMGGWLWFHVVRTIFRLVGISSPNPIPLLSSYSTLWAIIAIWLLFTVLCQITRTQQRPNGDRIIAALFTSFYAVTYFFWYYATTTEQYTSAIAQTLAMVYFYLRWKTAIEDDPETLAGRTLILLAFLCGLSLAHMLTVAFLVPPLVLVILWQRPKILRHWGLLGALILAAFLPLASYGYVYVRGAAHPEWWGNGNWQNASEWFWAFVSTAQGREELSWGLEQGRAFFGGQFPALMWQELSLPFLLFGIVGIRFLGRYLATVLYGTLLIHLVFCWMYRFGNWYQVILPVYPLILLGIVAPIRELECKSNALLPKAKRRWIILVLILAIFWRFDASLIPANSRHRAGDSALERAGVLLDQSIPSHAALFAAVDDTLALQYLIDIWQIRPDLQTISSDKAEGVLREGKPLLASWEALATLRSELPTGLAESLSLQPTALSPDWVELSAQGNSLIPSIKNHFVQAIQGESVTFEGYTISRSPAGSPVTSAPPALDIMLYWQLENGKWPSGLSISVRPMQNGAYISATDGSNAIIQQDTPAPMKGLLSSESFTAHALIADPYRLPVPIVGNNGVDQIQVILYRSSNQGFEQIAALLLPVKE